MNEHPLTIAQRIRVLASVSPAVRITVTSDDALKMARALERYDQLVASLAQIEALKTIFDRRVARLKRALLLSFLCSLTCFASLVVVVVPL